MNDRAFGSIMGADPHQQGVREGRHYMFQRKNAHRIIKKSALVLSASLAAACFFPLKSYAYLVITGNNSAPQIVNETTVGAASVGTGTFDAAFYAASYPDVAAALGTDPQVLYDHYISNGMREGRLPFNGAAPGQAVSGMAGTAAQPAQQTAQPVQQAAAVQSASAGFTPVPLGSLANYGSIKKRMTDEQFQQAYNVALQIVTPLAGKSREEQMKGIASALRARVDNGSVNYSMSSDHYNDPYGYFIDGAVSCAGCVRATGLCLNILGIPYEHVNENQYSHQWARVENNGTYWICDAFGLYVGPEPSPYQHPYIH